jgi:CO/xanthine dehydrogenase FAD-binding subunit
VRTDVVIPRSREEAVQAFGDGSGLTVIAGGTIVMPQIRSGSLRPQRALLLTRAGLGEVRRDNGMLRIGATASVASLEDAPEPLATFARGVADYEVRAQGTVGGNVCARPGPTAPRGDLQAALLAMGARVRSTSAGGERTDSIDDFLAAPDGRLVLEIEVDEPKRASSASVRRPHSHAYTILAVACAETSEGVRVAAIGAGARARRLMAVEEAFRGGGDATAAAAGAGEGIAFQDDALASAWYREKMLPILVERALNEL